jgi:hypothetical protein
MSHVTGMRGWDRQNGRRKIVLSRQKFRHMEDQLIISDSGALITVDIATAPD